MQLRWQQRFLVPCDPKQFLLTGSNWLSIQQRFHCFQWKGRESIDTCWKGIIIIVYLNPWKPSFVSLTFIFILAKGTPLIFVPQKALICSQIKYVFLCLLRILSMPVELQQVFKSSMMIIAFYFQCAKH